MGLISRTADLYYTFRFLKLLVTPWEETDAYKLGILDKDGKVLRRAATLRTDKEKTAYTYFHRLVFNIKRMLNTIPFGRTRLASYAAALYLIKEETGMSNEGLRKIFERLDVPVDMKLQENTWFLTKEGHLQPGMYTLLNEVPMATTGEFIARAGTRIEIKAATPPLGEAVGIPVFRAFHKETQQYVIVSTEDISR